MASPAPLPEANTAFSQALLKKLSDEDNGANVFFSPFSISSALAMVMLGARGNTAAQMSEVLRFTEAKKPHLPGEQQMMQTQQHVELKLPEFLKTVTKPTRAGVEWAN